MVHSITACPRRWKRCHPHHCTFTPRGDPQPPAKPQPPTTGGSQPSPYNVIYLVDEHVVSDLSQNQKINRLDQRTVRRRYVWYHDSVNLDTFNVPEIPMNIELDPMIRDPKQNKNFKWEGFMFDIPAEKNAVRVAIVAEADKASNDSLNGNGGLGGATVDRVVGFAATYADSEVPIGPVCQIRRDDQYKLLGASLNSEVKVVWRCAYYITRETPKHSTSPRPGPTRPLMVGPSDDEKEDSSVSPPADEHVTHDANTDLYDELLDKNVPNDTAIYEGADKWGGQLCNLDSTYDIPVDTPDDSDLLGPGDLSTQPASGPEAV